MLAGIAAAGTTYTVTSTSLCGGAGNFQQALVDANANPGIDTISFAPGLVVDAYTCTTAAPRPFPFATFATESVDIVGNGATIEGGQYYAAGNGLINVPSTCPQHDPTTRALSVTYGFIQIGTHDVDNSGVAVSITGMKFHNLPMLAQVEQNASLTMTDSSASDIVDFNGDCDRSAINGAQGANVTLTRTRIVDSTMPRAGHGEGSIDAVISVDGNLVLDHAQFGSNNFGRAVAWFGGSAKIVSSLFVNSSGLILNANSTFVVNSAFYEDGVIGRQPLGRQAPANRIVSGMGHTLIQASSFYWVDPTCAACADKGMGLWITGLAAAVDFDSSAIGTQLILADTGPLLLGYNGTGGRSNGFHSDALTWVQPTANQDAAALQAVLPSVMTNPPGLISDVMASVLPYPAVLTPLLGTINIPGVLLDAVANAQCGGANHLLSPIDGSCIATDVFGNPRVDAGNNKRNIGAVQTAQSPHLAVTSVTADIGLGWNRPPDPVSGPITGYRVVTYVLVAGGTPQTVDVTGPDTTSTAITGLTLGTQYRFTVAALNVAGAGTPSNEVLATPLGAIGPPTVSASGGDTSAQVSWTEPTLGGHPGPPSYYVMYRPAGTTTWIQGPGPLSARTTTIPELLNGATYDVGVFATSTDGTASTLATTTVTLPATPPAAPTLTATPGGAGSGQIVLSWTKPADGGSPITGYLVQCRPTGSTPWTAYPASGLGTSLAVTGLQSGTPYECEVAAVNANGVGSWSAFAEATPPPVTPTTGPTTTAPTTTQPTTTGPTTTTAEPPSTVTVPASTTTVQSTTTIQPAPTSTGGDGSLARTGFDGVSLSLTGLALVGGGLALVMAARRRRSSR